jgi:hypothetical protein
MLKFLGTMLFATIAIAQTGTFVERMMAFDANHDGKLTKDEITDDRLLRLFDRADANHDGVVTKEELTALYAKEATNGFPGRGGPPPPQQPGQILPMPMQRMLSLTAKQTAALAELQHEVDAKLDVLLTAEQKAQLKEMGQRGPGGPGGPGPRRP